MSINLQKGQKIDLTKTNAGLSRILVGLGWDPIENNNKGIFGMFRSSSNSNFDCDASVFMLDKDGKLSDNKDIVYFGNLKSRCGGVVHTGDNLTGEGDGDDEQILIDLNKIDSRIERLLFTVNIYNGVERRQDFGMVRNAFIRIVNNDNRTELIKYNLTDSYSGKTALMIGELYRYNGEWKFAAVGEGTNDAGLKDVANRLRK